MVTAGQGGRRARGAAARGASGASAWSRRRAVGIAGAPFSQFLAGEAIDARALSHVGQEESLDLLRAQPLKELPEPLASPQSPDLLEPLVLGRPRVLVLPRLVARALGLAVGGGVALDC